MKPSSRSARIDLQRKLQQSDTINARELNNELSTDVADIPFGSGRSVGRSGGQLRQIDGVRGDLTFAFDGFTGRHAVDLLQPGRRGADDGRRSSADRASAPYSGDRAAWAAGADQGLGQPACTAVQPRRSFAESCGG